MAELSLTTTKRRFYFNWLPDIFFRPRLVFQRIAPTTTVVWITPLLVLSCLVLINSLVAGRIKYQNATMGEITYPPEYYTPEQQAQYTQAVQSTQGPVFVYILPSIASLLGVWISWLILGGFCIWLQRYLEVGGAR